MNFIVPTGIPAIRLTIYNNVTNGNGNDFALDDIEIRLCMTPDTILTDTTVCDTLSRITWHGKEFAITDLAGSHGTEKSLPSPIPYATLFVALVVLTAYTT